MTTSKIANKNSRKYRPWEQWKEENDKRIEDNNPARTCSRTLRNTSKEGESSKLKWKEGEDSSINVGANDKNKSKEKSLHK